LLSQIAELDTKADYLFVELGVAQSVVSERGTELARLVEEADEERARLLSQIAELDTKAEYLFVELGVAQSVVSERGTELARLVEEADEERARLLSQIAELDTKADYLFVELGVAQSVVSERESQISSLQRRFSTADRELTSVSIALVAELQRTSELERLVARGLVLEDFALRILEDNSRLTSKIRYRLFRTLKLGIKRMQFFRSDRNYLKNDVLPIPFESQIVLKEIVAGSCVWGQYLDMYPDIKSSGINPYTHFFLHGKKEDRSSSVKSGPI
jgi:hypothetical protein